MKILIVGSGETAAHLASLLSKENQDVILMDRDCERLDQLDARLNIMTCEGNPVSARDLTRAGCDECDLCVCITPFEDINIISAQIAKRLGASRTVARIDNAEFLGEGMRKLFKDTGVDSLVYPEFLASERIGDFLKRNWTTDWFELHNGALIVASVKIDNPELEWLNLPLHELTDWRDGLHVCAIRRKGATIIPRGGDCLQQGDTIYFSILTQGEDDLMQLCGKENREIKRVLVTGAGKMTAMILRQLSEAYDITVVEADRERCLKISRLPLRFTIANADPRDIDALCEEGIRTTDAFIALNESSEANIVGCMLARQLGVPHTIAEIEEVQYFSETDSLGIDTVVNKKLMTASHIFQTLLDTVLDTPRCLALDDAEVFEIVASKGCLATRSKIRDIRMPKGMTIAGLIRRGEGMLVSGDTDIEEGDHIVVFCLRGILNKVEHIFR